LSSFEQEGWASSLPPLHPSSLTEVSQQHQPHNAQRPKKKTTGSGGSGNGSTAAQEGDSTKMTSPQGRRKGSVPKGDDSCLQQQ
jgi:hypothetical protein